MKKKKCLHICFKSRRPLYSGGVCANACKTHS